MTVKNGKNSIFFCTSCGYESKKWMGQCPACGEWNTFAEETFTESARKKQSSGGIRKSHAELKPVTLSEIETDAEDRMDTGFPELSRVLGGGIVRGSLTLVGGDPGIGKSTILLQAAGRMAAMGKSVIYVSGEESLRQIRLRADRIGSMPESLKFISETDIDDIIEMLCINRPDLCIIDSIQTMYTTEAQSVPGSVTQVRECAQRLMTCSKTENIACILVGHVTKEGTVAGPRVLEHIVDTVLYFESGDQFGYRILRSAKNRFGSTNELGVFEMSSEGLKEVLNPSEFLLDGRPEKATGAAVTCLIEGSRPLLMEVQGLVTETQYGMARRQANGMDYNRFAMLLAVLTKRCGLKLGAMDAYVNIAGGMKISQPAADLAIAAAVISSVFDLPVPENTVVFGEIGLSGEVRGVPYVSERLREASKLGFKRAVIPAVGMRSLKDTEGMQITGVGYVSELLNIIKGA